MRKFSLFLAVVLVLSCGCTKRPASVSFPKGGITSSRRIVFDSNRGGKVDIFTMFADGGQAADLSQKLGSLNLDPAWDADQKKIYFSSNWKGHLDVYVMDADGSNPKQLTSGSGENYAPSVSPDGQTVAFVSSRGGSPQIYVMSSDGGNVRLLLKGGSATAPAFSPDGRSIAFVKLSKNQGSLSVADSGGADERSLGAAVMPDGGPVWSPDGNLIAFVTQKEGAYELDTIKPNGKELNVLVKTSSNLKALGSPSFNPDGGSLCFAGYLQKSFYDQHWKIYLSDLQGNNLNPISSSVADSDDRQPSWSRH